MRRFVYLASSLAALGALGLIFAQGSENEARLGEGRYRDERGRLGREGLANGATSAGGGLSALATGLVRYYPLSGDAIDVVGGINGTISGPSAAFAAGHVSPQAMSLGSNSANKFYAPYFGGGDFSVSFWVYLNGSLANFTGVIGNMTLTGAVTSEWMFLGNTTNFTLFKGGNAGAGGAGSVAALSTTGAWHHVVLTRAGASPNNAVIYVDAVAGAVFSLDVTTLALTDRFIIGCRTDEFVATTALFQDVGLWGRGLGADEVVQLNNSGAGRTFPF